jgi:exonuclease SbcD
LDEQRLLLKEILDLATSLGVDALLVCGDVFDKPQPPEDALQLWDWFLSEFRRRTDASLVVISGNHDSAIRLRVAHELLNQSRVHIISDLHLARRPLVLHGIEFWCLPFGTPQQIWYELGVRQPSTEQLTFESALGAWLTEVHRPTAGAPQVLLAHLTTLGGSVSSSERALVSIGTAESVPLSHFHGFDHVALGHLHRAQQFQFQFTRIAYSGSLYTYSASEVGQQKSVTLVETAGHQSDAWTARLLSLTAGRPVSRVCGQVEELLAENSEAMHLADGFVFVQITDPVPRADANTRLRERFPYLLSVEWTPPQLPDVSDLYDQLNEVTDLAADSSQGLQRALIDFVSQHGVVQRQFDESDLVVLARHMDDADAPT